MRKFVIPDVKKMKAEDAVLELTKKNFKVKEEYSYRSVYLEEDGIVLDTIPQVGEKISKDEEIELIVTKRKLIPIIIILLSLLAIIISGFTISSIVNGNNLVIARYGIGWSKEDTVYVKTEPNNIKYYEYCIIKDNSSDKCNWKKTKTKNVKITENGIWNVIFRGVKINNSYTKVSNTLKVYIDNTTPQIKNVKTTYKNGEYTINLNIDDDGKTKVYYQINGGKKILGSKTIVLKGLSDDVIYKITITIIDEAGNSETIEYRIDPADFKKDDDSSSNNDDTNNSNENTNSNPNDNSESNSNETDSTDKEDSSSSSELDVPIIDLSGIPAVFEYKSSYVVPTKVSFGNSEGNYVCYLEDNTTLTNTKDIKIGKHTITCDATNIENVKATVSKEIEVTIQTGEDEDFEGWIRMNLYFPENSTEWMYKIQNEDTIRTGNNDWIPYTGPILVRLSDVENVYIKYKMNGEEVIMPPAGKLLVMIQPESSSVLENETTNVSILFDKSASTKQYRINGGEWTTYTDTFEVEPNSLIEAKVIKDESVYDAYGEFIAKRKVSNVDSVFISEKSLEQKNNITIDTPNNPNLPIIYIDGDDGFESIIDPGTPIKPSSYLAGPTISSNPNSGIVESTKVSITTAEPASNIYIKINDNKYVEYVDPITINENSTIKAYYIRKSDGKTSDTSYYYVDNIKQPKLPYVSIKATPNNYLEEYQNEVEVTINASDYDTLEYSLDGSLYKTYNGSFNVSESSYVYAKGTNSFGSRIESLMIPTTTVKPQKEELSVSINVSPSSKEVVGLINKAVVTIDYDPAATEKYYKVGYNGKTLEYTGPFEINTNDTIYAYAVSENGYGKDELGVNHLTTGISAPIIKADTKNIYQSLPVTIDFASTSTVKKYRINNQDWQVYTGPFQVEENCLITAFNSDSLGNRNESQIQINNIKALPNYILIDKGDYFIIKPNFPDSSDPASREYKWTEKGEWKPYNSNTGFILVKSELKDKVSKGDSIVVKDSNGKETVFSDDYYFVSTEELKNLGDNLFMRWDMGKPSKPSIILSSTDPDKSVDVTIKYDPTSTKKYYKILDSKGITPWLEYNGPISVSENDVTIYARSENSSEVLSDVATYKISNIDTEKPSIEFKADLTNPKKKVDIKVIGLDNLGIDTVGYAKGSKDEKFFNENGTVLPNNGVFTATENGIYTIFAKDLVGNIITKEIEITNIDEQAPNVSINVLTKKFGTTAEVEIDFGDSTTKRYRIGNTGNYTDYTDKLTINSKDVLDKVNEDGTLTVFAEGIDAAGNVTTTEEIIYVLDLDAPAAPIIKATAGYPMFTEYGIEPDNRNTIIFDKTRDDIDNYYSLDNGETWKIYTGVFKTTSGTILAKSVKKESGLTIQSSATVKAPTDAVPTIEYDGNNKTCTGSGGKNIYQKILVDPALIGTTVNYEYTAGGGGSSGMSIVGIYMYDENDTQLYSYTNTTTTELTTKDVKIVDNTSYIKFRISYGSGWGGSSNSSLCEVRIDTRPTFKETKHYPKITLYGIEKVYNEIEISYFQTAVEKYYKINDGEWLKYQNTPINVSIGDTIYAKSIDKYGNESVTRSLKASNADYLPEAAYDGDSSTYVVNNTWYIDVAKNTWGEKLLYDVDSVGQYSVQGKVILTMLNSSGTSLSSMTSQISGGGRTTGTMTIPEGTTRMQVYTKTNSTQGRVFELRLVNDPKIIPTRVYPTLTSYGVDKAYTMISADFHASSKERKYRVNSGEWKNFEDEVRIETGDTIEIYGIDKYGNESAHTSYKAVMASDEISNLLYDNNTATGVTTNGNNLVQKIAIDPSLYNSEIMYTYSAGGGGSSGQSQVLVNFYDESGTSLKTENNNTVVSNVTNKIVVPEGTKYLVFNLNYGSGWGSRSNCSVWEVSVNNKPKFSEDKHYPVINNNSVTPGYTNVSVSYHHTAVKKYYRINDGEWIEYTTPFVAKYKDKVEAMSTDKYNEQSEIGVLTIELMSDELPPIAFDGNSSTFVPAREKSLSYKALINPDTIGNNLVYTINAYGGGQASNVLSLTKATFYDSSNNSLGSVVNTKSGNNFENKIVIPANSSYVIFDMIPGGGWSGTNSETDLIDVYVQPNQGESTVKSKKLVIQPKISVSTSDINKVISITYDNNYTLEYSLDYGNTWVKYDNEIVVNKNCTIIARSINEQGKVLSASSFTITKVSSPNPDSDINSDEDPDDNQNSSLNNDIINESSQNDELINKEEEEKTTEGGNNNETN